MTGTVINPLQVPGTVDMSTSRTPSVSHMNFVRISAVVDRLLAYVRGGSRNDSNEFFKLCISLSRVIDYAVANKEIPVKASELPGLLKQICQWKNDAPLQAAIMVLLISLKGACRNGWFSEKDNEELQKLSNEISGSFCSVKEMNFGENIVHHSISAVMLRFYPSMKMGETLAFVEAKPGYGAFLKDFDITTKAMSSNNKIYLFVAQVDDTETSSCIISPQQVNFLLNGRAVNGRTCVSKDPGPQTPTLVTHMLKLGTNLLQVVGQFNGNYIIIVAFMSMISNPISPTIPNYVPPVAAAPDPDNELTEGPSTTSLNCPISFKRIKTPVKGQLCKHRQCFDYDNYVDINSRRPSWKCPHCSQSVCFTDIRIDRIMVKVLKEVGVNVSHVRISADGSWEAVKEEDDHNTDNNNNNKLQSTPPLHQNMGPGILDLTEGDNYINATATDPHHQNIDKKPSPSQLQNPNSTNIRNIPLPPNGFQKIQTSNPMVPPVQMNPILQGQSQLSASNTMQSKDVNGIVRYPTHSSRHITRIPIAVQALPAQTSAGPGSGGLDGFYMNPHQINRTVSVPPSQHMGPQEFDGGYQYNSHQQHQSPQVQQVGVGPTNGILSNQQNYAMSMSMSAQQQAATNAHVNNQLAQAHHYAMSTATNGHVSNNQQARHHAMSAAQQGFHVRSWTPSLHDHGDQNWRPSGRMRGSLSGQAYSEALNQYVYHPTQPVQATRPPVLNTPRPVIPPHLQFLFANNRNMIGDNSLLYDNTNGGGGGGFR
ncbi:hypothetical protein Lser_V15G30343 [Lactuca serriola]